MNDNMMNNNNNNVEEVPLDLFDQVSLDDYQPTESVAPVQSVETTPTQPSANVISIPADAYNAALLAERQRLTQQQPQQNN